MKKWILSMVAVLLVGSMALMACAAPAPAPAPAPTPAPTPAPEVLKLRTQYFTGDVDGYGGTAFGDFIDKVKILTDGRLDMTPIMPGGAVCSAPEMFDAISTGLLDVGLSLGAYYTGKIPVGNIETGLSFGLRSALDQYCLLYERGLLDVYRGEYAKHNIYLVTVMPATWNALLTRDKPIHKMEDLEGMKIRVTGEPQYAFEKFGAALTVVAYPELYSATQTGVIDGFVTGIQGIPEWYYHEVTKYYGPSFKLDTSNVMINMDVWNQLPDDEKRVVNAMGEFFCWRFRGAFEHIEQIAEAVAAEKGMVKVELPAAELAKWREVAISEGWVWAAAQDAASAEAIKIITDYYREEGVIE